MKRAKKIYDLLEYWSAPFPAGSVETFPKGSLTPLSICISYKGYTFHATGHQVEVTLLNTINANPFELKDYIDGVLKLKSKIDGNQNSALITNKVPNNKITIVISDKYRKDTESIKDSVVNIIYCNEDGILDDGDFDLSLLKDDEVAEFNWDTLDLHTAPYYLIFTDDLPSNLIDGIKDFYESTRPDHISFEYHESAVSLSEEIERIKSSFS